MDLDFEDLITQSIITNSVSRRVSVKTTQSREYDLVYNQKDSTFDIKVRKDGFICDECGEIYAEEEELTDHKRLQKCRRKYKTKAELKEIPFENDVNKFLQINISTYNEITEEEHRHHSSADVEDDNNTSSSDEQTSENQETDVDDDDDEEEDYQVIENHPQPQAASDALKCVECGRICASKLGLAAHSRTHRPKPGRKTMERS